MTNEVSKILANTLLPLVDDECISVLCGLVKTAVQTREGGATSRFPVPYDSDSPAHQIDNSDLIPDASRRAIVYFEGNDTNVTDYQRKKSVVNTGLRLVCWYDSNKFSSENLSVHTALMGNFLGLIKEARTRPGDVICGLSVTATRIVDSYETLFSKYSYKTERGQYLLKPYFAFGIDLTVNYQINHGCATRPLPVKLSDCC